MGVLQKSIEDGNKQFPSGGKYFTFSEGDNNIRIVSLTEALGQHYSPGDGYNVCFGKDNGCPRCEEDKPSVYFFVWIIDRSDGSIKQAKLSYTIMKSIDDVTEMEEHEFISEESGMFPYDINIRKIEGKKKNEKTQYNIMPAPKTDLTEKEMESLVALKSPKEMVEEMKLDSADKSGVALASDKNNLNPAAGEKIPY